MGKPSVRFTDEFISLMDDNHELVYWGIDEWKEDPEVVFSVVNAVKLLYEEGPEKIKEILCICPVCGEIALPFKGRTSDGRMIGVCGDAFELESWKHF